MEIQANRQFSPYFASFNFDPAQDSEQDRLEFSQKFSALPKTIKYGFLSEEIENSIRDVSQKYNITEPQKIGEVARMVRGFYLNGKKEKDWEGAFRNQINLENAKIQGSITDIKNIVTKVQEVGNQILKDSVEKLPIIPALKKYEKLGDQEITEHQIEIEIGDTREFVNPSIKNWLEDYIQNKGAQAHSNLERSDYLYKSKNTQELSTDERNTLSVILFSYDKDELLAINKEGQEVFFDDTLSVLEGLNDQQETNNFQVKSVPESEKNGKIELAPATSVSQETTSDKESNDSSADEGISKKSHEISWYGTNPFDSLEKINENKNKQSEQIVKQVDFDSKRNAQATKHVIDLKNN